MNNSKQTNEIYFFIVFHVDLHERWPLQEETMHSRGQAWESLEFRFWTPAATAPSVLEETGHSYFVKLSLLSSSGGI